MIDSMPRRGDRASDCEMCQRKTATRMAKFTAHFLQSEPTPLMIEEHFAKMEFEKRVCDDCAEQLQNMKNVTDLSFGSL